MSKLRSVDWVRSSPYWALHLACLLAFVPGVGFSWLALGVCVALYAVRVFALTAFYHRYFSHRTFTTTRWFAFVGALLGNLAAQKGPIWWAAHHRDHHRYSDKEQDVHSPVVHGFIWSHMLWFLTPENFKTNISNVPDLYKRWELRLIDRYEFVAPIALAVGLFFLGWGLHEWAPSLGVNGMQMLVWGFFISTVAVYHVTYSINSLAHVIGKRRFKTTDDSRNNWLLALLTFGEGWHNNHHYFPNSARQGFYWWEIDLSYYTLVVLSWFGLVWDLKRVPDKVLQAGLRQAPAPAAAQQR
ncbi:MAG TPA: acyl-CoA desaturase [Pirellulaceae bacterium]|jgi:stearoyl-CoA desaturase (delta-9 desaturase)|nr:acyl-CoA desaturase [Pirellulaceae bacterium]